VRDNLGAHMSIAGGLPNALRRGREVGCSVVQIFLNDARAGLGSGLDRHQHIGRGQIGPGAFRALLRHPRLRRVPMALETPKEDRWDQRNLATLRRLRAAPAAPRVPR